jgi:hypothetical protein
MTKPCIRCGCVRPLDGFYVHPRMADGHLNKCKECCKEYARHSLRVKLGDSAWVQSERKRGRDKYHRLYAPVDPLVFTTQAVPLVIKQRARNAVGNAVRDGRVSRPDRCEACGKNGRIHGHQLTTGDRLMFSGSARPVTASVTTSGGQ